MQAQKGRQDTWFPGSGSHSLQPNIQDKICLTLPELQSPNIAMPSPSLPGPFTPPSPPSGVGSHTSLMGLPEARKVKAQVWKLGELLHENMKEEEVAILVDRNSGLRKRD